MDKEIKENEAPNWIIFLVGLGITFVGNLFPAGYAGETAGTLLDLFGVAIMIYAVVKFFKNRRMGK